VDKVTSDLMICYYRLSSEDGDVVRGNAAESFSISAQRLCVQNFLASRPDLEGTVEEIVDDGYTGTNMNRPGMQRLLSLVKSGSVKTVIVRDLSRFSRNFLEGGHYLEFVFPAYGVRFISINDHFDSADYGESTGGLELGITNLLNQLYSRDLSRKIKSVTDRKKLNGEYAFGAVPYGYQKGEQKNTIVVDPPAADVVRQIFQWASQGISITQIAQRLNASGTETPSVYLAKARGRYKVRKFWTYESVRNILQNRIYTGDTEAFKSHVVKVGSNRTKLLPEAERPIIPHTHEPIVSRELYFLARSTVQKTAPKTPAGNTPSLLQPYLVCGCCGNHLVKGKASNKNWRCASARYVPESGCAEVCISDADLQAILIRAINMQCRLRDARLETYQRQFESHASKRRAINARMQRVQAEIHRKQEELMSLYEAHVGGRLSKESFTEKRESLLRAQNEKKQQLAQLESDWELLCAEEETAKKEEQQTSALSPYHEISALDPALMRELVCEISVFHRQKIQIEWKFFDFTSELVE
jgi:hypothetical protein